MPPSAVVRVNESGKQSDGAWSTGSAAVNVATILLHPHQGCEVAPAVTAWVLGSEQVVEDNSFGDVHVAGFARKPKEFQRQLQQRHCRTSFRDSPFVGQVEVGLKVFAQTRPACDVEVVRHDVV